MMQPEARRAVYFGKKKVPATLPNVDDAIISDGIYRVQVEEDGTVTKTLIPIDVANSGRDGTPDKKEEE